MPFLLLLAVLAADRYPDLPAELAEFVPAGHTALEVERGDLNGDGRGDYILIVEKDAKTPEEEREERPRPLLIVVRTAGGKLALAKRNDKAVYCSVCGGMLGDPFQGITIKGQRFTIEHYGGSSWRWANSATFAWSRRDRTWQLVRVEDVQFHAGDPDSTTERTVRRPPKDFGKIDIAEFDPEHYHR